MTPVTLHVGTYADAGGRGLMRIVYDTEAGFMSAEDDPVAANASFAARSARNDLYYLVNEQADGRLGVYRRAGRAWQRLAEISSEGREPCYVVLAPDERSVALANYASGSIALIGLTPDGMPDGRTAVWANHGSGPDRERQEAPHMHCVRFSPDGASLYAADLGTDQLLRFDLSDSLQLDAPALDWAAPPGSGPRHLVFHPAQPLAVLVSELDSMLTLFDASAPSLAPITRCGTTPGASADGNLGGHVELDATGTRVYVTNRGHDNIAVFALDPAAGTLTPIHRVNSGGRSPRHFLLLEEVARLFVVNEKSGNLVAFAIDSDKCLHPTRHEIKIAGAASVFATWA